MRIIPISVHVNGTGTHRGQAFDGTHWQAAGWLGVGEEQRRDC